MKRSTHGRHQTSTHRQSCSLRCLQSPSHHERIRRQGRDDLPRVFRDAHGTTGQDADDELRGFGEAGGLSTLNRAAEINNGELLLLVVLVALSAFLMGMYAKAEWPHLVHAVEAK